jgi:hypothetical protein
MAKDPQDPGTLELPLPDPDALVTVEAMGFTWRLPRSVVEADIASGFAVEIKQA